MADPNSPLEEWLHKHHARCLAGGEVGRQYHALYIVNGRLLIVTREPDNTGWDIFIPASSQNNISATLKAVEVACGLQSE